MDLEPQSVIAVYSTGAQIFGALLGLLGISAVWQFEVSDSNNHQQISGIVDSIMELLEELGMGDVDVQLSSIPELRYLVEKLQVFEKNETKRSAILRKIDAFEASIGTQRRVRRQFKILSYSHVVIIVFGIAGLSQILPPRLLYFYSVLLTVVLIWTGHFFIAMANYEKLYVFNRKPTKSIPFT